jgi:hypothetical protein
MVVLSPAHALHAGDPHQVGDALAPDMHAVGGQFGVHPGHPVGPARAAVDRLDLRAQRDVGPGAPPSGYYAWQQQKKIYRPR